MHHTLKFYSRYRELFLRYYIYQGKWVRLPVLGGIVRAVAGLYGKKAHRAYLLTLEEANRLIDASSRLALGPCACRKVFKNCDNPVEAEIMVGIGTQVFPAERPGDYREISRQEAKDVLQACHERHLLHTLVRCREDFYALCNCCSCCCVPLRLKRDYHIGHALVRGHNIVEAFQESQLSKA